VEYFLELHSLFYFFQSKKYYILLQGRGRMEEDFDTRAQGLCPVSHLSSAEISGGTQGTFPLNIQNMKVAEDFFGQDINHLNWCRKC